MSINDLPDAIQWHEGMLLAPQHFQQLVLRCDALLHYHTAAISPFHWGVRRWKLDTTLLVHGRFRVLELEAVMPDGLVISLGEEDSQTLELDLTPYTEELRTEPRTIYQTVPSRQSARSSDNGDGELRRYDSVDGDPVNDDVSGSGELRIPRLRPRIRLSLGDVPPAKYVSFPLARVAHRNEMFVRTDFVPPTLLVAPHSPLGELCLSITRRLREKAMYLSEQVAAHGRVMGRDAVQDYKSMIRAIVESLPYTEALIRSGAAHPFQLYLALCTLAGRTAALSSAMLPPDFSPYDHNDPLASFQQPRAFILKMVDENILETYFSVAFQFRDDVFSVRFEDAWKDRQLLIGVRPADNVPVKDVITWVHESLIGAGSMMQSLRERRIRGVEREQQETEDVFAAARGFTLFSLDPGSEFICPGEQLNVLNVADRSDAAIPAEMLLFISKEQSSPEISA
jgi:type VI secretion system protein ImpJ